MRRSRTPAAPRRRARAYRELQPLQQPVRRRQDRLGRRLGHRDRECRQRTQVGVFPRLDVPTRQPAMAQRRRPGAHSAPSWIHAGHAAPGTAPRCCRRSRSRRLRDQVGVALGLELPRQLRTAAAHDAARRHHVHMVRHDVVEQPLVMGDDQRREVRCRAVRSRRRPRCAARRCRGRCRSRPEWRASGAAALICSTSLRFFSPPEKPTLTLRLSIVVRHAEPLALGPRQLEERPPHPAPARRAPGAAFTAVRRKLALPTPGSSTGAWNARNSPGRGTRLRLHGQQVLPSNVQRSHRSPRNPSRPDST